MEHRSTHNIAALCGVMVGVIVGAGSVLTAQSVGGDTFSWRLAPGQEEVNSRDANDTEQLGDTLQLQEREESRNERAQRNDQVDEINAREHAAAPEGNGTARVNNHCDGLSGVRWAHCVVNERLKIRWLHHDAE